MSKRHVGDGVVLEDILIQASSAAGFEFRGEGKPLRGDIL